MTTQADLKAICDELNGYTGSKADDNVNKIWAELQPSFQGASYCAAGDCYIWKHAGHPFPAIDHPWGFSYCPDAVIWAKHNGLWDASGHYETGDTIFFDWDGHGVAEHTGTVIYDDGATIHTFECNTSPEHSNGSQSNGGGCYYRTRSHGPTVLGVLKSSQWLSGHPAPKPKPKQRTQALRRHNPNHFDPRALPLSARLHSRGDTVRWAQWALAVPVDGTFGPQSDKATRLFQRHAGLGVDGVVGQHTAAALMKVTH